VLGWKVDETGSGSYPAVGFGMARHVCHQAAVVRR
jgi:hypothetical protein